MTAARDRARAEPPASAPAPARAPARTRARALARRAAGRWTTARADHRVATRAPRPDALFTSRWTEVATACGPVRMHDRRSRHAPDEAPAVVLVHGLAMSHRYLMPLAARLAPHHPVHAVDLPGFGLSDEPGRVLDLRELADALATWLRAVPRAPAVVLGNSVGCQVAVELAARRPELVRSLVLVGPTIDRHARGPVRQAVNWLRDVRHEDPLQATIIARDLVDAGLRRGVLMLRHALRDAIEDTLPDVAVPVLVTRGDREPVVSPRWAAEVARALPYGRLAVVPRSPHNATYTAADRLAPLVLSFVAETEAERGRRGG